VSGPPGSSILLTPRLRVRPWDRVADLQAVVELFDDPAVVQFIGRRRVADTAAARAFLDKRLARPRGPGMGYWAVTERESGQVVGSANLDPIPTDDGRVSDDVQLGIALRPAWWRRGLATELGVGLLRHADELGLAEVVAVVEPGNTASHAMIHRLGFIREGPTTDYYGGETLVRYRRAQGTPAPRPPDPPRG
jgi:RimJ/RimL family protein N-acetyltransferase